MYLKINFECMMIYVFVNLKSPKCIKSVHERKHKWYKFLSKYRKKMCCSNNSIKVNNGNMFYTIVT